MNTMKHSFKYIAAVLALCATTGAKAQNLYSAYYMDGYAYGHEMNPAKDYDRKSYFSLPLLPLNINIGVAGNVGLKSFLKPLNDGSGKLGTILHPAISYDDAMSGLHKNNKIMETLHWDLLSFGFHAFKGYNTMTVGLRQEFGFNMPKDIFGMMKSLENKDYNFSGLGAQASSFLEVAIGHSHNINDAWRIGAKAKVLLGLAYADAKLNNVHLDLTGQDKWTATADASVDLGVGGLTWGEGVNRGDEIDFDNVDVKSPGLGGLGFAMDLGAEWDLGKQGWVDGLSVNAAILDPGFIKWKNVAMAKNMGEPFEFTGFNDIKIEDGTGVEFDDQIDDYGDRLENLYNFRSDSVSSKTRMLGMTFNVGVNYVLPCWKKVDFGFLSTTHLQGRYTWNEERFSVNLHPCKLFEMGVNLGVGTLGTSLGWILNFHPRGFNLFLASDRLCMKYSKQMVPLKPQANIAMGINFPLGKNHAERFVKKPAAQ